MGKDYERREGALFLLQKYSTMDQEAQYILPSVYRYTDELFIDALKDASPDLVLELLKAFREAFVEKYQLRNPERCAEYSDLSATIAILEKKKLE